MRSSLYEYGEAPMQVSLTVVDAAQDLIKRYEKLSPKQRIREENILFEEPGFLDAEYMNLSGAGGLGTRI